MVRTDRACSSSSTQWSEDPLPGQGSDGVKCPHLCILDRRGHALGSPCGIQREAINELRVQSTLAVTLQDMDIANRTLRLAVFVHLDAKGCRDC